MHLKSKPRLGFKADSQFALSFRGWVVEINIDPDMSSLKNMENEKWAKVVTNLVDEVGHVPAARTRFCADPDGAVYAVAVTSNKKIDTAYAGPSSLGVREYRKIYEEYCFVLGTVPFPECIASNDYADSDNESTNGNRRHTMTFTSFDLEAVRDLIVRVTELVTVDQRDARTTATVAALQRSHAVLNRTIELGTNLDVTTRQFEAASGVERTVSSPRRLNPCFRRQMDSIKLTKNV